MNTTSLYLICDQLVVFYSCRIHHILIIGVTSIDLGFLLMIYGMTVSMADTSASHWNDSAGLLKSCLPQPHAATRGKLEMLVQ